MDCTRRSMTMRLLAPKWHKDNFKVESRKLGRGSELWMDVKQAAGSPGETREVKL